jgi:hypothetical protein
MLMRNLKEFDDDNMWKTVGKTAAVLNKVTALYDWVSL